MCWARPWELVLAVHSSWADTRDMLHSQQPPIKCTLWIWRSNHPIPQLGTRCFSPTSTPTSSFRCGLMCVFLITPHNLCQTISCLVHHFTPYKVKANLLRWVMRLEQNETFSLLHRSPIVEYWVYHKALRWNRQEANLSGFCPFKGCLSFPLSLDVPNSFF